MNILAKIMLLLILLTVIPLSILGTIALSDIFVMQTTAEAHVNSIATTAVDDSAEALNKLGAQYIQQVAEDVAKQLEIYILANPGKTVIDLQQDEVFKALAVQPVGETGYTAITDVETLTCRFHAAEAIIDMDLHLLAEKLPGFWGVMSRTQGGQVSEGYYDWAEADGSMRQKYMYIAIVDAQTADGVMFSVAATTYIDEFNMPASDINTKIRKEVAEISNSMHTLANDVRKKTAYFVIGVLLFVVLISFIFARSITLPIKRITEAAKMVSDGKLDTELPVIRTKDEIKELGDTMNLLMGAVKYLQKENKK